LTGRNTRKRRISIEKIIHAVFMLVPQRYDAEATATKTALVTLRETSNVLRTLIFTGSKNQRLLVTIRERSATKLDVSQGSSAIK